MGRYKSSISRLTIHLILQQQQYVVTGENLIIINTLFFEGVGDGDCTEDEGMHLQVIINVMYLHGFASYSF